MTNSYRIAVPLLAVLAAGCDSVAGPVGTGADAVALSAAHAAPHTPAAGTFSQTGITSLDVSQAGPNTILKQTSTGSLSGTLTGSYTDDVEVVIHPNGRFNAHFTIRCICTVNGEQGTLDLVASDRGEMVSPTVATFAGRAVITGGTGDLAALRGALAIEGTVDLTTGLSTYAYSGRIH